MASVPTAGSLLRDSVPAAEYVRMSSDHQRYSTANQSTLINEYAIGHGFTIVRTYTDEGKSGLDIGGRDALQSLIDDVQTGRANFRVVLVYDVSRWGRFQNADESAHYEYLCTKAGIRVIYCAEPFDNDGSSLATIVKNVKRAMAGEYSRELSVKVFAGQCRLVRLGFHQGGRAGYGLRRALVDDRGAPKGELSFGQRKSIQTDRVLLVAGPQSEIDVVRRIYETFVHTSASEQKIADLLNAEALSPEPGFPWTRSRVHDVLTNEKYIGNNVYNRRSGKLRERATDNAPEHWVRCDGAFEGIISVALFERAGQIILQRSQHLDDAKMLQLLRELLARAGKLSGLIINEQDDMPSTVAYSKRFGGLIRAYSLIGYQAERDLGFIAVNRELRQWRPRMLGDIVDLLQGAGARVQRNPETDLLTVNDEWTASVVIAKCLQAAAGHRRWTVRFDTKLASDLTLVVRMDHLNVKALDYYLIPRIDLGAWPRRLHERNHGLIDSYRFDSLDVLADLAAREPLKEAA